MTETEARGDHTLLHMACFFVELWGPLNSSSAVVDTPYTFIWGVYAFEISMARYFVLEYDRTMLFPLGAITVSSFHADVDVEYSLLQ